MQRATPRELIFKGFFDLLESKTQSPYRCKLSEYFKIQIINLVLYGVFDIQDINLDALSDPRLDNSVQDTEEIDEMVAVTNEIAKAVFCINMECEPEKYQWKCDLKHGSALKDQQFSKHSIMHHHVIVRPEISRLVSKSKKYVTGDWILYKINPATKEIYIIGIFLHPDNIIRYKLLHDAWKNGTNIQSILDEIDKTFNTVDPTKLAQISKFSTKGIDNLNTELIDNIMEHEKW